MQESRILRDVSERLEKLTIHELRQVARAVGVHRPADGKKSRVTEDILSIAQGILAPEPPSLRGAPPKSHTFDESLVADIKTCREYYLALKNGASTENNVMGVADSAYSNDIEEKCQGILDKSDKLYFLRVNGCSVTDGKDVFVHNSFVNRYNLRVGDCVVGKCRRRNVAEAAGLVSVVSVNGKSVQTGQTRRNFSEFTHAYPCRQIKTACDKDDTACRIIDLFSPVAMGQRAFIVAPKKSGKSSLIKRIAPHICRNYAHLKVVVVIIDELPEEVNDLKRTLTDCTLFCTTFDMGKENHIHTAELATEYAKRQVEEGEDVVIIFDGVTRLAHAYGLYGQNANAANSTTNGADEIKKLLYCACNAEEGGSLTVISTLSSDAFDGAVFGEFIGSANMVVTLSPELSARRIFPAIDVLNSYASGEERILKVEEITAASSLRAEMRSGLSAEELINMFKNTADNAEIVKKYKN